MGNSALIKIYYPIKRYLPRTLQLILRRGVALAQRGMNRRRWPIDVDCARPPEHWTGWPDGKRFALVLTHDVDTQRGHDNSLNLMNLEREAGFVSSFNFVAGEYTVSPMLRRTLAQNGFEVGVHGLYHNAELYASREKFNRHAARINGYLHDWQAVGFRSPCMYHNLDWMHALDISYDASTFDTDPFEPQPDGVGTIFPFFVEAEGARGYVELPYTLPQDFTLFVLFKEKDIRTWKRKLEWVAQQGGMVLVNTHPDYMNFGNGKCDYEHYQARLYRDLLDLIKTEYTDRYWHVLPRQIAEFWRASGNRKTGKWPADTVGASGITGAGACA